MRTIDLRFQDPSPDASTETQENSDVETTDPDEGETSDEDCKRQRTGAQKPQKGSRKAASPRDRHLAEPTGVIDCELPSPCVARNERCCPGRVDLSLPSGPLESAYVFDDGVRYIVHHCISPGWRLQCSSVR